MFQGFQAGMTSDAQATRRRRNSNKADDDSSSSSVPKTPAKAVPKKM